MQPQFKLVGEEVILNNRDWFWVSEQASHISLKNGKVGFWILLNPHPSQTDNHRSTNNRRFVKKQGNCFFLPGFKLSIGSGYCYDPICWEWRCRSCLNEMSVQLLGPDEVCFRCSHPATKKTISPS